MFDEHTRVQGCRALFFAKGLGDSWPWLTRMQECMFIVVPI